ncbi:hypothetical protein GFK82_00418 [Candidatus Steffania adelgidicola]|nr:hypothetical protein GFK82_00418 [Candidatus Steffania adelgidicola]
MLTCIALWRESRMISTTLRMDFANFTKRKNITDIIKSYSELVVKGRKTNKPLDLFPKVKSVSNF